MILTRESVREKYSTDKNLYTEKPTCGCESDSSIFHLLTIRVQDHPNRLK